MWINTHPQPGLFRRFNAAVKFAGIVEAARTAIARRVVEVHRIDIFDTAPRPGRV